MVKKAAPAKVKKESHGGAIAIGGYLYQVLCTTAHQVSTRSFSPKDPLSDALIYIHEAFDQDAAVVDPQEKGIGLIQVKFSSDATNNPIPPSELKAIARALLKASKAAIAEGHRVNRYQLFSNRGLSKAAEKHREKCKHTQNKKKATFEEPTQNFILSQLQELVIDESAVKAQLKEFGKSFGLTDAEYEDGIERLVAKVFAGVALNREHPVKIADLNEIFTGNPNAKPLTKTQLSEKFGDELERIMKKEFADNHFPRERAQQVLIKNPGRALFVFFGEGGMGKTASLRFLASQEIKPATGPFLVGGKASSARLGWADSYIAKWCGTSRFVADTFQGAINRLKAANSDVGPPILMLALDGIDEDVKELHEDYIRTLIGDLAAIDRESRNSDRRPDVRLFVTCRKEAEIHKFLELDSSGFESEPAKDYHPVEFGPFTPDEFWNVVQNHAPKLAERMFQEDFFLGSTSTAAQTRIKPLPKVLPHLDFLRDPLVWRAFLMLDEDVQRKLLEGKTAAETKLGIRLLERFCTKANARRGWNANELTKVLKFVEKQFRNGKKKRNRVTWVAEGLKLGIFDYNKCEQLFDEALSGGLINGASEDWSWRNRIIELALKP